MAKFHDFLVEHVKFPFPLPGELRTADTADVSDFDAGLLERERVCVCVCGKLSTLSETMLLYGNFVIVSRILSGTPLYRPILKRALLTKFSPQRIACYPG